MLVESDNIISSPEISILVITYNQERWIEQCLNGILDQKLNVPYEVIIAEDCSKDKTREIVIDYQKRFPQIIRLILQNTNQGISGNYLSGLKLCRGRFIAQIAGDDFWCNSMKLQMQYDYMKSHERCGLCYTNVKSCDEDGNILDCSYLKGKSLSKTFEEHLLSPNFIAPLSWMFKKEIADMYEDKHWVDESVAIALDAFANYDVYYMTECTAVYRLRDNSASSYINPAYYFKHEKGVWEICKYYADKYKCKEELQKKVIMSGYLSLLPLAIEAGNDAFVEETNKWFMSERLDVSVIIRNLRADEKRKNGRAYRLGKTILKPFKWLKGIIGK